MSRTFLFVALLLAGCHSSAAVPSSPAAAAPGAGARPASPILDIAASPGAPGLDPGAAAARRGDWSAARAALAAALEGVVAADRIDTTVAAHALLGRACEHLHDAACGDREARAALDAWGDQRNAAARLAAISTDPGAATERRERLLEAVGEAIFILGENARAEAERVPMPRMHGPTGSQSAIDFYNVELRPWVERKRAKVDAAAKAYERILDTDVSPPPHWHLACAAAAGEMKGRFVSEVRSAPIPDEWKRDGEVPGGRGQSYAELRRQLHRGLVEATGPMETSARHAFSVCAKVAAKWGIDDATSRRCAAWLDEHAVPATEPSVARSPEPARPPSGLLPERFRDPKRIVAVVQPSPGATLEVGRGSERAVLHVPEYALSRPTQVTLEIVAPRTPVPRLGATYRVALAGDPGCAGCELEVSLGDKRKTANLANEMLLDDGVPMLMVNAPLHLDAEAKTASFDAVLASRFHLYLTDAPPARRDDASGRPVAATAPARP